MINGSREKMSKKQYVRIHLPNHFASLRIVKIHGHSLQTTARKVMLVNISAGGACIATGFKLPVSDKVLVEIRVELCGKTLDLMGTVIWRSHVENIYKYGIEFNITSLKRILLIRLLDMLIMQLHTYNERIHSIYHGISMNYERDCLLAGNQSNVATGGWHDP